AMSIEHHVRNEVRFSKVSNWKVYCMQTEEESRESQPEGWRGKIRLYGTAGQCPALPQRRACGGCGL
ncbi:hypothetical protein, partial [Phocaeicola sp.]|uniref:hypothetical protein n=1 Tax=Phocaeicola sp. TaxID=2773926 RepID=UPI003AB3EA57